MIGEDDVIRISDKVGYGWSAEAAIDDWIARKIILNIFPIGKRWAPNKQYRMLQGNMNAVLFFECPDVISKGLCNEQGIAKQQENKHPAEDSEIHIASNNELNISFFQNLLLSAFIEYPLIQTPGTWSVKKDDQREEPK